MGCWLKWEKGLERKQEVLQIAARLLMPPAQAAGTLMIVMSWLDDNVSEYRDGCHACVTLKSLNVSFVDVIAGVTGFGEALAEVGWLRLEEGVLVFVNAGRHNGKTAKHRALATDRQQNRRAKTCHADRHAPSVTPLLLSQSGSEEGVKGEKPAKGPPNTTVIPLLLSTNAFAEAWRAWLQHRREIKKPIAAGSETEKQQLKTLETWGETRAIAAIRYTIFKGWQGLREADPNDKEYANHPASNSRGFEQSGSYAGVTEK
jgi:hypothetical protein